MAQPRIDTFDPSPFIRSTGQAFGKAAENIGLIASDAINKSAPHRAKAKNKNSLIEQTMKVEEEQYEFNDQLYGPDVRDPLIKTESFVQDSSLKDEALPTEEFIRGGNKMTDSKVVNSKQFKKKEQYLSNLRRDLSNLSNEELKDYQLGRAHYEKAKNESSQEFGQNGMQWTRPSVQEMTFAGQTIAKSGGDKNPFIDKVQAYRSKDATKQLSGMMQEYLSLPEVRQASKQIGEGQAVSSEAGTEIGFRKWAMGKYGVPDADVIGYGDEKGMRPGDNLNEGRYNGKKIGILGTAEAAQVINKTLDDFNSRRSDSRMKQTAGATDKRLTDQANQKASNQSNTKEDKTSEINQKSKENTAKIIRDNIQKYTSEGASARKALSNFKAGNGMLLEKEFADKSESQIEDMIAKADNKMQQAEQQDQVMVALDKMGNTDRIDEVSVRNLATLVYDNKPDTPGSTVFKIREALGLVDKEKPQLEENFGIPNPNQAPSREESLPPFGSKGLNEPAPATPSEGPLKVTMKNGEQVEVTNRFQTVGEATKAKKDGIISSGDVIWIAEENAARMVK